MSWYSEYNKSLKMAAVEEYIDLVFYRPLAFLLVKSIYSTRIKPDNLTFAAIITGLTAAVFYSLGHPWAATTGAVLYALFIVLDCSDGQLARLKKDGSPIGRIVDGAADYMVVTAIYVGLAISFSRDKSIPATILGWLLLSGVSTVIQSMLVDFFRTRFLDIVVKQQSTFGDGIIEYRKAYLKLKNSKGKWLEKKIIYLYLLYSGLQSKLTHRKHKIEFSDVSADEYFRKNRLIIRFWVLIGPSASRTTLIICTFLKRLDLYLFITIIVFNVLVILLLIIQHGIDKSYRTNLN